MPRAIRWVEEPMETVSGRIIDAVGYLGPLKAFTLYQACGPKGYVQEWNLTSHFIPTKLRNASFRSVTDGQRACEKIVVGFAKWLSD